MICWVLLHSHCSAVWLVFICAFFDFGMCYVCMSLHVYLFSFIVIHYVPPTHLPSFTLLLLFSLCLWSLSSVLIWLFLVLSSYCFIISSLLFVFLRLFVLFFLFFFFGVLRVLLCFPPLRSSYLFITHTPGLPMYFAYRLLFCSPP